MGKYASTIVKQAKAWVGKKESDGSHKEIIDVYNSHKPLARNYKVKYTDNWCMTFISALAIKCGFTDIIPTECSCGKMIELCQKAKIWVENENRTPKVGEIIFYDWDDNGKGDNKGWADHVGIVEKVENGKITVIEGNHDGSDADKIDGVERRTIDVNGKNIRGYACPKYDAEPKKEEPKKEEAKAEEKPKAETTKEVKAKDPARSQDEKLNATYKVYDCSSLNVRHGAGTNKAVMVVIPKDTKVRCYGYYTTAESRKWLYVKFTYKGKTYIGFCSERKLKKV